MIIHMSECYFNIKQAAVILGINTGAARNVCTFLGVKTTEVQNRGLPTKLYLKTDLDKIASLKDHCK